MPAVLLKRKKKPGNIVVHTYFQQGFVWKPVETSD